MHSPLNAPLTIAIYGSVKFGARRSRQPGTMSYFPTAMRLSVRAARLSALLFAAGAGFSPHGAAAQETSALRGTVSGDLLAQPSLADSQTALAGSSQAAPPPAPNAAAAGQAQDTDPFATGTSPSTPSAMTTGSIFDQDSGAGDPFAESAPVAAGRPAAAKTTGLATSQPKASAKGSAGAAGEEEPEVTGILPQKSIDASADERNTRAEPESQREEPIEGTRRAKDDDDPYAPLGLRAGTFILRPALETGLTGTTNADSSPNGKAALLSQTTLRLNAVSDWSRHSMSFDAYGIFRKSVAGAPLSQTIGGANTQVNLDLARDLRGIIKLGYTITPQTAESPVFIEGTTGEPNQQDLTASVGLQKDVGKLRLGISENIERLIYGDAHLASGGVLSQRDRDSTLVSTVLRTGYEISPAVTPFIEGEVGRRYYDQKIDDAGFARSAGRIGLRAGVALDFSEKLSGELSAGWLREKPDDARLGAVSGPSIAADLKWSPLRGTTVSLNAATVIEGSTTPDQAGDILYTGGISIERILRANLTGVASFGTLWRTYSGTGDHDFGWSAEAGLTYWLNRNVGITGRLHHEEQLSNVAGRNYKMSSVFLGLTLQR